MLGFHLGEAREHGAHAELRRFAAIDAGEQRVSQAIDHLGAVVALDESGDRFVFGGFARRMKPFARHAQLGLHRKQRRHHRGRELGGDHEHQAVGHFDQLALHQNVSLAVGVVGADELIAQADLLAEFDGPGLFGEERVGAGFEDAAVDLVSDEDAAKTRTRFVEDVLDLNASPAFFFERVRRRETGDAAADDG